MKSQAGGATGLRVLRDQDPREHVPAGEAGPLRHARSTQLLSRNTHRRPEHLTGACADRDDQGHGAADEGPREDGRHPFHGAHPHVQHMTGPQSPSTQNLEMVTLSSSAIPDTIQDVGVYHARGEPCDTLGSVLDDRERHGSHMLVYEHADPAPPDPGR